MKKSKRQLRGQLGSKSDRGHTPSPYEFHPDYSYVIKDLRRIGILAGTFVVILVGLSFFLG